MHKAAKDQSKVGEKQDRLGTRSGSRQVTQGWGWHGFRGAVSAAIDGMTKLDLEV